MLYRACWYTLLGLIIWLNFNMLYNKNGLAKTIFLKNELCLEEQKLLNLKQNTDQLVKDISLLRTDPIALEEKARLDLGVIKKGEKFWQVIE